MANSNGKTKSASRAAPPAKAMKSPRKALQSTNLPAAKKTLAALDVAGGCQTSAFAGEILIDDDAGQSFLVTAGEKYLNMLDPECSGIYDAGRVGEAYQKYSMDPGQGGHLSCNGFLKSHGGGTVLHIVS